MKILTLSGKTHIFRKEINRAMIDVRASMRVSQSSGTAYADGDILLCHHFPRSADTFHRMRFHNFYNDEEFDGSPSVAASYLPESAMPNGRWQIFAMLGGLSFPVDFQKVFYNQPRVLVFRSGEDEANIAQMLQRCVLASKGERLRFDIRMRTFRPMRDT